MRKRPNFECCDCRRIFGQVVDLEDDPILVVECPYCGAECKVDISPYRQRVVTVLRGGESDSGATGYELPGTVPTVRTGDDQTQGKD